VTFEVLAEARLEAVEAAIWYDDRRLGLGSEFLVEFQAAIDRVRQRPRELSRLEAYSGPHDIRRCLLRRFPYLVIFVYRPDETVVIAVSHARRHPLYWLERLR
jgi:hypothetical protein